MELGFALRPICPITVPDYQEDEQPVQVFSK